VPVNVRFAPLLPAIWVTTAPAAFVKERNDPGGKFLTSTDNREPGRLGLTLTMPLLMARPMFFEKSSVTKLDPDILNGKSAAVGILEGNRDGAADGCTEGNELGFDDGIDDGNDDGCADGNDEGCEEGPADGLDDGFADGFDDGLADGPDDGNIEGADDGRDEGFDDGLSEGSRDGALEGDCDGSREGVREGSVEGIADGRGVRTTEIYMKADSTLVSTSPPVPSVTLLFGAKLPPVAISVEITSTTIPFVPEKLPTSPVRGLNVMPACKNRSRANSRSAGVGPVAFTT
jgi:hypothetical protein